MSKQPFIIKAFQLDDVAAAAEMGADAFLADRHTEMKSHGVAEPYDMKKVNMENMPVYLGNPRCVVRKAVDPETGELMGWCNWGFRGFSADEIPHVEGRAAPVWYDAKPSSPESREEEQPEEEKDGVKRLMALTDRDMNAWMEEVMPPGIKCIYVVGLIVSPKFQGLGIGRALLQWGLDVCEERGVFAWVHSSEPAWQMYQKVGFQTMRELDLDLDAYAPGPPIHEGPDAKWGHYVIRYMKYFPKQL